MKVAKNGERSFAKVSHPFTFTVPTHEYRSLPIPCLEGTKVGDCFVNVTSLPEELDLFMEVNPRIPEQKSERSAFGSCS